MKIIDNLNNLLGDELQQMPTPNTKLQKDISFRVLKKEHDNE